MTNKITLFKDDNSFLSNFYPCEIVLDGVDYPSVEHAFQAAKTRDLNARMSIRALDKPGQAKRYGRTVKLREGWDDMKLEVMESLVRQKFTNDWYLAERLLKTGDAELVEGNWWGDTYWGVCMGKGENHLGKILMRVREELRAQRKEE